MPRRSPMSRQNLGYPIRRRAKHASASRCRCHASRATTACVSSTSSVVVWPMVAAAVESATSSLSRASTSPVRRRRTTKSCVSRGVIRVRAIERVRRRNLAKPRVGRGGLIRAHLRSAFPPLSAVPVTREPSPKFAERRLRPLLFRRQLPFGPLSLLRGRERPLRSATLRHRRLRFRTCQHSAATPSIAHSMLTNL